MPVFYFGYILTLPYTVLLSSLPTSTSRLYLPTSHLLRAKIDSAWLILLLQAPPLPHSLARQRRPLRKRDGADRKDQATRHPRFRRSDMS